MKRLSLQDRGQHANATSGRIYIQSKRTPGAVLRSGAMSLLVMSKLVQIAGEKIFRVFHRETETPPPQSRFDKDSARGL